MLSLPAGGASIDGHVATLRIELQRDRFALTDHDTAYREGADVPLA